MDLYTYFTTQKGNNIIKNAHYFPIYERHLRQFVGRSITMLEIGTGQGGSCGMWKYYFGPRAKIVTIDIDPKNIEDEQIYFRQGDQSDMQFLDRILKEFGPPDIVLDDGSHLMKHINASFDFIFPRMSRDGVYLVEDLDGAYWPKRGGGLSHPDSFIERAKSLIDQMNSDYIDRLDNKNPDYDGICNISFYHMIVAIERSSYLNKKMMQLPRPFGEK